MYRPLGFTMLPSLNEWIFLLSDGSLIPSHFHVTEVGIITKTFLDCGGDLRSNKMVNF